MNYARQFIQNTVIGGVLVLLPLYLALLLALKGMQTVASLVHPVAVLLPDWLPAETLLSVLLLVAACFVVGLAVRAPAGRAARERLERSLLGRLPGYAVLRSMTQRITGNNDENGWKPALVELEDALVPAFIVEQLDDGRYTVFVPSVPTPLAGSVYILPTGRVHPIDVPFTQAIRSVSQWGVGSKHLVAAMKAQSS